MNLNSLRPFGGESADRTPTMPRDPPNSIQTAAGPKVREWEPLP
jgi:hypothetical protein